MVGLPQLVLGDAGLQLGVAGGQNAPVDGQQVGHESHLQGAAHHLGQGLLNLRGVAVGRHLVGGEALVELGVVVALGGLAPRAGDAGFAVGDDAVTLDKPGLQGGHQGQGHRRGVAARVGDDLLPPNLLPEELRQAVHRLFVEGLVLVGAAVPLLVSGLVLQAEVRAHVDEGLAQGVALGGQVLGEAVGQRGKDDVALLHHLVLGAADQINHLVVGGVHLGEGHALKADGADGGQLRLGMARNQPADFAARVARGSHHAHSDLLHVNFPPFPAVPTPAGPGLSRSPGRGRPAPSGRPRTSPGRWRRTRPHQRRGRQPGTPPGAGSPK